MKEKKLDPKYKHTPRRQYERKKYRLFIYKANETTAFIHTKLSKHIITIPYWKFYINILRQKNVRKKNGIWSCHAQA